MMFHWYGLIVGLAASVVIWGVDDSLHRFKTPHTPNWHTGKQLVILLITIVMARAWHVATDWQLYQHALIEVVFIWQGGLSILGALVGLFLGTLIVIPQAKSRQWLFDVVALWLPLGQSLGRIANWVNQELYGLPTQVPWGIYIDPTHRLPEFQAVAYYHPLFAYEMIGLWGIAAVVWLMVKKQSTVVGTGLVASAYLTGYVWLRFWLDFLRIDRDGVVFGTNQLVLLGVGLALLLWWGFQFRHRVFGVRRPSLGWLVIGGLVVMGIWRGIITLTAYRNHSLASSQEITVIGVQVAAALRQLPDQSVTTVQVGNHHIGVVVVNQPQSLQQGLGGYAVIPQQGMLFVFPGRQRQLFWMKGMRFAIDLVWISGGKIVEITPAVPPPVSGQPDAKLPLYEPRQAVEMVLEVVAGQSQVWGWQVGDEVSWKRP